MQVNINFLSTYSKKSLKLAYNSFKKMEVHRNGNYVGQGRAEDWRAAAKAGKLEQL